MYVEFMKNVFLPNSSELMGVRLIFVSWAQKRLFLLSRHDVHRVDKKLFSRRYERAIRCFTNFGFLSPKTFDSYFLDIMYVEFMRKFFQPIRANWWVLDSFRPPEPKNVSFLLYRHHVRRIDEKFFLADSSELMGVRLIFASWAQKRLIPTF